MVECKSNAPRTGVTAVLLLVVLFFVVGCGASPQQKRVATGHITTGVAHLGEGQESQALRSFLEAEQIDPRNERAHYFKGVIYANRGMLPEAKEVLLTAVKINPRYSQALTFLGSLYIQEKRYDQARECLQKALQNPLYDAPAAALYNLGNAYRQQGEGAAKAIEYWERAVVVDPESPLLSMIHAQLGDAYLAGGDYVRAQDHYEKSLVREPGNHEIEKKLLEAKKGQSAQGAALPPLPPPR